MTRKRAFLLLLFASALAAVSFWQVRPGKQIAVAAAAPEPAVISDAVLETEEWHSQLAAFGQLRAAQGADLSAPVAGIVASISFRPGDEVKAGTVLVRLRPYDDEAKLKQLQAMVALGRANLARDEKQFAAQAVSRAALDLDDANLRQYEAQLEAQQQLIEQKILRAPFDGRIGLRQVDQGQYLSPGTPVASIQALDRLYIDFNIVQRDVAAVRPGQTARITVDAWPGRVFEGRVMAIDSVVDPQSRMASVRATLDNHDRALLPGMFAVAHLDVGSARQVITVPQGAVSFSPYGNFVYLLTPKPDAPDRFIATSQVVQLGEKQGDRVVITDGLKTGDRIVIAGGFKLRSGATVVVDNSVVQPTRPDPLVAEE